MAAKKPIIEHPHKDVIIAYLNHKPCQFRIRVSDNWTELESLADTECFPAFFIDWEYRIKPELKKTVGYRRFVSSAPAIVAMCYENAITGSPFYYEKKPWFVRWIDTEWQYEEYEEKES